MSNYTFTFKKGDIFVEFTTTDRYIVERQFQLWVGEASEYANRVKSQVSTDEKKKLKPAEPTVEKVTAPKREEQVQKAATVEQPVSEPVEKQVKVEEVKPEIVEAPASIEVPSIQEAQIPQIEEQKIEEPEVEKEQQEEPIEVFEKASTLLKTINSIQNPEPEKIEEPAAIDFEKVLEKSIDNPTFEPTKVKDQKFLNLIASKNTSDKFHYLIITAYYLLEYEKMDRFSLKQINAKLMQNLSEIVDHSVLKSAIEQQFIELIPDLTGMAEIAEYRLTEKGEDFFFNRIV